MCCQVIDTSALGKSTTLRSRLAPFPFCGGNHLDGEIPPTMEHVAKEEEQVRKAKLLESHKRQGPWLASRVCVESHSRSIFKPHPVCSRAILPGICASLATPTSRSRESFRSPGRVQGCLSRHRCSVNKGVTPLPEPSRTGALGRWENMLLHHP